MIRYRCLATALTFSLALGLIAPAVRGDIVVNFNDLSYGAPDTTRISARAGYGQL